ncbi:MAG: phosphate propanoyltransferase [Clostridiales bacterium]|nr:phosphate propanoyltransferase [Clostridiales bacterium]MBP3940612.1 phosphate propanoyltransferase [Christensenellaceae bacterium]MBR3842258.1 phosphate propanoyltransferase [Christensenellaceae bacterium]
MEFKVEVSARHIHLTQEHVEALFGAGHQLTFIRELSQPGQYLCEEKVTLVKGDRKLERVSVLGPVRKSSQVELSRTDCISLRANAIVRESGDTAGTEAVTLVGPAGTVELEEGLIVAKAHIHATPEDAEKLGVKDKDIVNVAVEGEGRKLVFGNIVVRVNPTYALAMHIDTDEGNAAYLPRSGGTGRIVTVENF